MKSKLLLFLFSFSAIVIFIITFNSCKKVALDEVFTPEFDKTFNTAAAKEWYYGTFKKSAEWASYYSIKSGTTANNGAIASTEKAAKPNELKLPDWKHGVYRKVGNMEVMEFPLHKAHRSISIPNKSLTEGEKKKIAAASLTRIVFIKRGENIYVREIDYIPEWQYLQKKKFDISDVMFGKPGNDFTGRLFIKKWGGSVLSLNLLENGKIIKKGRINKSSRNSASFSTTQICEEIETCIWRQDCVNYYVADVLNETVCGDEYNTGECTTEEFCEEVEDDGGCPPGVSDEECLCLLYGICDDPCGTCPPPPDDNNQCKMTDSEAQQLLDAMAVDKTVTFTWTTGPEIIDNGIIKQSAIGTCDIFSLEVTPGLWVRYSANFPGIRYKLNTGDRWKWESLEKSDLISENGAYPICLDGEMSASISTPIISSDPEVANVALRYELKCRIVCLAGWKVKTFRGDWPAQVISANF